MIPVYIPVYPTVGDGWGEQPHYAYDDLIRQIPASPQLVEATRRLVQLRPGHRPGKPGWDRGHEIDVASRLAFREWIIAGMPVPG